MSPKTSQTNKSSASGPFFEHEGKVHALEKTFVGRSQVRDVAHCGAERTLPSVGEYIEDGGAMTCATCIEGCCGGPR